jgi:hypothetical protein
MFGDFIQSQVFPVILGHSEQLEDGETYCGDERWMELSRDYIQCWALM